MIFLLSILITGISYGDLRMIPPLGEASTSQIRSYQEVDRVVFEVIPPQGEHQGLTVTGWIRLPVHGDSELTTYAFWCNETIDKSAPDKLGGQGGYMGDSIDLTVLGGSIAFPDLGFTPYLDHANQIVPLGDKGTATVAGWAENAITVSAGGNDINLPAGEFNKNVEMGPGDYIAVTGVGLLNIGASQTPFYRLHQTVSDRLYALDSTITNVFAMATWRWKVLPDGSQICKLDVGRLHVFDDVGITSTNTSANCQAMSGLGYYSIGLIGARASPPYDVDIFDFRVFPRYLEQEEMERIHINGVQEITRRGLDGPATP